MSVALRLSRFGRKKKPFYRIVAADSHMKRDGRFLERLGTVDPLQDPPAVKLDEERTKYWLSVGAQASETVASIIKREIPGHLEGIISARKEKIKANRAARKARAK